MKSYSKNKECKEIFRKLINGMKISEDEAILLTNNCQRETFIEDENVIEYLSDDEEKLDMYLANISALNLLKNSLNHFRGYTTSCDEIDEAQTTKYILSILEKIEEKGTGLVRRQRGY